MKRNKNRGAVSVLLCVVLLSFVILAGAASDACSLAVANAYAQRIHYLSAKSVLAEYDRHLFEDYGLMAYDGGEEEIAASIRQYGDRMVRVSADSSDEIVFFDLKLEEVQVQCEGRLLGDRDIFMEQIREAMKYQTVETGAEFLSSLTGISSGIGNLYQDAKENYDAEQTALAETPQPDPETGEVPENPAARDPLDLKQTAFDPDNVPEGRTLRSRFVIDSLPSKTADGSHLNGRLFRLDKEEDLMELGKDSSDYLDTLFSGISSGTDKLVMMGYINTHFRSLLKEDASGGETFFLGEKEYLLVGKLSDKSNLASIRRELFLLRTGLNIAHIYSDAEKYQLTQAAAAATGAELFLPAVQFLIAAAWAGAEASEDIDTLMQGGKIPLMKQASDWKLSLDSLYGDKTIQGSHQEGRGLDYDGYLNLLMFTKSLSDLQLHSMDLIQINMKGRYDKSFDFRNCVVGFEAISQFERIAHLPSVLPGIIENNAMQAEGVFEY